MSTDIKQEKAPAEMTGAFTQFGLFCKSTNDFDDLLERGSDLTNVDRFHNGHQAVDNALKSIALEKSHKLIENRHQLLHLFSPSFFISQPKLQDDKK